MSVVPLPHTVDAPAAPTLARVVPIAPHLPPGPAAAPPPTAVEALGVLPGDWVVLDGVAAGPETADLAAVGPNGVFAVCRDPDPRPGAVRERLGLVRAGARDPEPVKRALRTATALRARLSHLPGDVFPYPVLVSPVPGEAGHRLGRLLVVRPGRFAEAVWRHPSRPLRRSERAAIVACLRDGSTGV